MGAEGHAVCLRGQGRRGWTLSGRGDSTATALAILSGRCLRGGGGGGAVDRVAAVERVAPGSQRALADRPSPPLVSLAPRQGNRTKSWGLVPRHPHVAASRRFCRVSRARPPWPAPARCLHSAATLSGRLLPSPPCSEPPSFLLPRMTRVDLRNYLERIYNVPVAAVRTRVQHGGSRGRGFLPELSRPGCQPRWPGPRQPL